MLARSNTLPPVAPRDPALFSTRLQPPTLTILIADPTGGDRLPRVMDELRDLRLSMPLEIVGVVGGDDPSRLGELQRRFPLVTMRGVWGAVGLGALLAAGAKMAQSRYILLLDGTTTIDAGLITGMMQFMDKGQWVGAIGPRLVTAEGDERSSARAFPTIAAVKDLVKGRMVMAEPAPRLQYALNRQVTTPKEVDAVLSGCCMIRKKAFDEVGGWDSGYATGGEALDWCRRAKARGWSVFYHPGVTALVQEPAAADPSAIADELASALRYLSAHAGFGTVALLKLMLAAASARTMLVQGGASLLPGAHRASARFGFWRAWHAMATLVLPRRATA